jgi:hypothetical protein
MAAVDSTTPVPGPADVSGAVDTATRRLVVASVVAAGLAIVAIGWATATKNHAFWAFVIWVGFTVGAIVAGVVALARLPRDRARRPLRRLALTGVVGGVLCATLGLAVYSATRTDDCPPDRACTIPQPGPGQRSQQP